jgi:hypothetical protein
MFQIQHQHLRPMPDNIGADLVTGVDHMNGTNMPGKILGQNLSSSGVGLEEDYSKWLHAHPPGSAHLQRLTVTIPPLNEKERAAMTAVRYMRYIWNSDSSGHAGKLGGPPH